MPWHDIACVMTGAVATDLSRHFIQRWNAIRNNRLRNSTKGTTDRERHRKKPLLLPCYPCEPWTTFHLDKVLVDPRQSSVCQAQVLRSVCDWSLGVPAGNVRKGLRQEFHEWIKGSDKVTGSSTNNQDTEIGLETSILSAYINCILDAENFVYIENQFFISFITISDEDAEKASMDQLDVPSTHNAGSHTLTHHSAFTRLPPSSHSPKVKNRIMDALFIRILRAHRQRKPFRLYIILPLVPGFVGEYGDPSARSLYRILHFTRLSLFVGSNALIPRLKTFIPNPDEYVSICGLRTYNEWPDGNMRTEIVYVHSKFMIVDDRKMIIGSANLNDRSMRGKRDSELAVLIEMDPLESRQTNHSAFIRRVRRTLMAEHLGVLPSLRRAVCNEWPIEQLNDPVTDSFFYDVWKATANKNASIFEEVFNVVPTDNLLTFEECRKNKQKIPLIVSEPERAQQLLESVRGTLVTFPTLFLDLEDLTPPEGTMERVAPEKIWT
ncbi:unnamed protein product [Dicrocoelium dendriticum]|nr:unnamed protein product [Dicrocoelium dendriticum]